MKENNINEYQYPCSGCGACYAICPKSAIKYELNEDGFYEAKVIEEKCIHCGRCKRICSKKVKTETKEISEGVLYSSRTKDKETLSKCTSGGIAYEIGKYGIENGYKLVGVVYNYNLNIAETIITDTYEGLEKMIGSKYIQSNTAESFFKLIKQLKSDSNMKVIIFGVPCQIYGIRNAIEQEKINNEVIYVDLFCHGVPTYIVWKKYLKEIKEKKNIDKITNVNFRDKKYGWHNFVLKIQNKNNTIYNKSERDNFYKIFFDNILLNPSCRECELRKKKSSADIRLGDFWGEIYENDYKGVSAILILSNKGKMIINKISNNIEIIKKENLEEMLKYQSTKNYRNAQLYEEAMKTLKNNAELKKVIKLYRNKLGKKYRIKQNLKVLGAFLPNNVKTKLKKVYKGMN